MRTSLRLFLPLALSAATLTACHSANAPSAASAGPITQLPRALTADEQTILTGSNNFAFNLFYAIDSAAGVDSNVFVSPLSASVALGMTSAGAAGSTLTAMQQVLGYSGMSTDAMGESYQSLLALLISVDTNVTFHVANGIWYDLSITLLPSFTSTVTTDFDAKVQSADLTSTATASAINAWVDSSTNGKITTIVGNTLPQGLVAFLANAIYFHGFWSIPFDSSQTRDTAFTAGDGSSQSVAMMHLQSQDNGFAVDSGPGYLAIDLPYGRAAYRMTVILPETGITLDSVARAMRNGAWSGLGSLLDSVPGRPIQLSLPKFQITWGDTLNAPLTSLGMGIAFSNAADFSNLATGGPFEISQVFQKTFVNVNETGTTAAAATGVGVVPTDYQMPVVFTANHPFLYVIRERFSGAILFIGTFTHPPTTSS